MASPDGPQRGRVGRHALPSWFARPPLAGRLMLVTGSAPGPGWVRRRRRRDPRADARQHPSSERRAWSARLEPEYTRLAPPRGARRDVAAGSRTRPGPGARRPIPDLRLASLFSIAPQNGETRVRNAAAFLPPLRGALRASETSFCPMGLRPIPPALRAASSSRRDRNVAKLLTDGTSSGCTRSAPGLLSRGRGQAVARAISSSGRASAARGAGPDQRRSTSRCFSMISSSLRDSARFDFCLSSTM
jgi:hypothetical protein